MGRLAGCVVAVCVGACYAPVPADGVPCGDGAACPSGQGCDPATQRCTRMPGAPVDADVDARAPDAPPPDAGPSVFVDDFARPAGPDLGNGWIEKFPPAFALAGGEVTRIATSPESYRDILVYRPAAEDVRDVEVSIRVRFVQSPPRFAQIFVRARSSTIATPNRYDGYLLYVEGSTLDQVVLGRQLGDVFVATLGRVTLAEPLNTADRYRLSLRAVGASPVELAAKVEKLAGTTWAVIGTIAVTDDAPEQITEPGSVGFSGDEIAAYVYDELVRTPL